MRFEIGANCSYQAILTGNKYLRFGYSVTQNAIRRIISPNVGWLNPNTRALLTCGKTPRFFDGAPQLRNLPISSRRFLPKSPARHLARLSPIQRMILHTRPTNCISLRILWQPKLPSSENLPARRALSICFELLFAIRSIEVVLSFKIYHPFLKVQPRSTFTSVNVHIIQ